ncbi:6284_t:CDS:1 [Ambispora gerdemannii]|uniref:6284_t:CDS:1 n=1 Tax=Ambispora gerdemannii TaxID=144530 RepID=A0A9N8VSR4_9GLOM|nr:6284_t:CDS:1 [Ambispora gerdemannii]
MTDNNTETPKEILPPDCLYEIFKKLEDDKQTLFRCMLGNREWCCQIVPILWSYPFRSLSSGSQILIIPSFINCLNEQEKIALVNLDISLKASKRSRPVFEYSTFIKEINVEKLENSVEKWLKLSFPRETEAVLWSKVISVSKKFFQLIFRTSTAFENLHIEKTKVISYVPDFTMFPNAPKALAHLKIFKYCGWQGNYLHKDISNVTELLTAMKLMTRDLESIEIDFQNINKLNAQKLTDLVSLQNSLRYFKFVNFLDQYGEILMPGLREKQGNNIKTLFFHSLHFFADEPTYLEHLEYFKVLEALIFEDCQADVESDIESYEWWMSLAKGPMSLKRLYFNVKNLNGQVLIPIISHAKGNLQELIVRQECSSLLFNSINETSRNIVSLSVVIDGSAVNSLLNALVGLRQLEQLIIRQSLDGGTPISLEIWPKLAKILPKSLNYFLVDFNEFSADSLAIFLQTRETPIRQIGFGNADVFGSGHLVVIIYYAREKSIVRKVGFSTRSHRFQYSHFNREILSKAKEYIEFVDIIEFDKDPNFLGMRF